MHEDFLTRAEIKRNEYLLKTEELFVASKDKWLANFVVHFKDICAYIQKCQYEPALSAVSYLEYTMLYTNFIIRRYVADIFVYNEKSYLDRDQLVIGSYDISFLFVFFDKLWDDLISLRKRYVGLVSAKEITAFMMGTLPDFYSYLASITRFAIVECVDKSPFTDIVKNEEFMINVGDYMETTETVYWEKKHKDANKLAEWFSEQLWNKYIFGDYSGLDFSGKNFLYTDFRYARFQNSTLNLVNFEGSSLIGVNFRSVNMEGCRLDNCSINEADFSYAILKNASFINVCGRTGLPNDKEWQHVGFLPISFRHTNLINADFTGANLTDADFTGANLTKTNFTGAVLDGADFAGAALDDVDFTGTILDGVDLSATALKDMDFTTPEPDKAVFSDNIGGKTEFMRYYIMESSESIQLPTAPKGDNVEAVKASGLSQFNKIDYDTRSELISERLKLLMERYMPKYDFEPVIYFDTEKKEQAVFWRFRPPQYDDYQATYRNDGIISHISFPISNAPTVFTARSSRGIRSIVVRMAVAESALRRGILGVKFTKILDITP